MDGDDIEMVVDGREDIIRGLLVEVSRVAACLEEINYLTGKLGDYSIDAMGFMEKSSADIAEYRRFYDFLAGLLEDGQFSSARSLVRHAGKWVGDDLEKCLKEIYDARGEAGF